MRLSSAEGCSCLGEVSESLNALTWLAPGTAPQPALAASPFEPLCMNSDDNETAVLIS